MTRLAPAGVYGLECFSPILRITRSLDLMSGSGLTPRVVFKSVYPVGYLKVLSPTRAKRVVKILPRTRNISLGFDVWWNFIDMGASPMVFWFFIDDVSSVLPFCIMAGTSLHSIAVYLCLFVSVRLAVRPFQCVRPVIRLAGTF